MFINLGDNVDISVFNDIRNIDVVNVKSIDDLEKNDFVMKCFPDILDVTDYKEQGMDLFLKLTHDISEKNETNNNIASDVFKMRKPYITLGIIFINFFFFCICIMIESLMRMNNSCMIRIFLFFTNVNYFFKYFVTWSSGIYRIYICFRYSRTTSNNVYKTVVFLFGFSSKFSNVCC